MKKQYMAPAFTPIKLDVNGVGTSCTLSFSNWDLEQQCVIDLGKGLTTFAAPPNCIIPVGAANICYNTFQENNTVFGS